MKNDLRTWIRLVEDVSADNDEGDYYIAHITSFWITDDEGNSFEVEFQHPIAGVLRVDAPEIKAF